MKTGSKLYYSGPTIRTIDSVISVIIYYELSAVYDNYYLNNDRITSYQIIVSL